MSYNTLQHDLDLLDHLFLRWDARESIGTEIAHAIGVGSEYRFVRELMAAYRACGRRPIETAPKDGTDILAASGPQGAWVQCAWDEDDGWVTFNRCWERETHPKLAGREFSPTIWIPLPAQPAISAVPPSQADHIPDAGKMVPPSQGTETTFAISQDPATRAQVAAVILADGRDPRTGKPLTQPHPDVSGLVMVPREPTEAMLKAGNEQSLSTAVLMDDRRFACELATYRAMIAAFQSHQQEGA